MGERFKTQPPCSWAVFAKQTKQWSTTRQY